MICPVATKPKAPESAAMAMSPTRADQTLSADRSTRPVTPILARDE
jgi:hypothetical protein